jgi:hypothetical protein
MNFVVAFYPGLRLAVGEAAPWAIALRPYRPLLMWPSFDRLRYGDRRENVTGTDCAAHSVPPRDTYLPFLLLKSRC